MIHKERWLVLAAMALVLYFGILLVTLPGQKAEPAAGPQTGASQDPLPGIAPSSAPRSAWTRPRREGACSPKQVRYNETRAFPARLVFGIMVCNDETRDEARVSAAQHHIVAYSRQLKQLDVLFKSIALLTAERVHFAMVCDSESTYSDVLELVSEWPNKFCAKVSFSYQETSYPPEALHLKYLNRPCSSTRHFFPHYFPHEGRIINLDSDMIMLAPMGELWDHFDRFDGTDVIGSSALMFWPDDRFKHFPKPKHVIPGTNGTLFDDGVNTGIMLMDLNRWRGSWWPFEKYLHYVNDAVDKYGNFFVHPTQDIFNVWLGEFPEHYYELPCEWNIRTTQVWPSSGRRHKAEHFPRMCGFAEANGSKALHGAGGHFVDGSRGFSEMFAEFERFDMKIEALEDLQNRLEGIFDKDEVLARKKGWFLAHFLKQRPVSVTWLTLTHWHNVAHQTLVTILQNSGWW